MGNEGRKILITGAAGLLGQALLSVFEGRHKPIAVINSTELPEKLAHVDCVRADLSNPNECRNLFDNSGIDVVINSAAWVDVDGCENDRERAYNANFVIAKNITDAIAGRPIFLIQISTDYIFNGKNHPGKIDDSPAPLNYYGETKLLAEKYIRNNLKNFLIARTCSLIGAPNQGQTNLVNYFFESLKAGKKINAPTDLRANPIWVDDLAGLLLEAVNREIRGTVHLGGKDYLSRFEFAKTFAEVFGFDSNLIVPVTSNEQKRPATRPAYAGLDISETELRFETPLPGIRDELIRMRDMVC